MHHVTCQSFFYLQPHDGLSPPILPSSQHVSREPPPVYVTILPDTFTCKEEWLRTLVCFASPSSSSQWRPSKIRPRRGVAASILFSSPLFSFHSLRICFHASDVAFRPSLAPSLARMDTRCHRRSSCTSSSRLGVPAERLCGFERGERQGEKEGSICPSETRPGSNGIDVPFAPIWGMLRPTIPHAKMLPNSTKKRTKPYSVILSFTSYAAAAPKR